MFLHHCLDVAVTRVLLDYVVFQPLHWDWMILVTCAAEGTFKRWDSASMSAKTVTERNKVCVQSITQVKCTMTKLKTDFRPAQPAAPASRRHTERALPSSRNFSIQLFWSQMMKDEVIMFCLWQRALNTLPNRKEVYQHTPRRYLELPVL